MMDSINTEQRFRVIRKLDKMVSGESAKKSRNTDTEVCKGGGEDVSDPNTEPDT